MRKSAYFWLALLVLAGILAAYELIPDDREMAFIHLKDRDYELARREYQHLLEQGRNDVSLLAPMVDLSLQTGDLTTAAKAMELMVKEHPRHIEARRKLGRILRFQHRLDDYVANLEILCELKPTEQDLRELSRALDYLRQYDRQVRALKKLTELCPDQPDYAEELAEVLASRGRLADAAAALRTLNERNPGAMTEHRMMLLISLLLDSGRADEALALAAGRLERHWDAGEAANLAGLLNGRGHLGLATRLLGPHLDRALAARTAGTGRTAPSGGEPLPNWILMELGEAARAANDPGFARKAFALLGWDFLLPGPGSPASAASAISGDTNRAATVSASEWPLDAKAGLASLWIQDGDLESAWRLLMDLAQREDPPDWAVEDLASTSLELKRTREGFGVFETLRRRRPTPAVDAGWALLGTCAGDESAVAAWLQSLPPTEPQDDTLKQLCDLAGEHGRTNLAAAATARLFRRHPTNANRASWVEALVHAGRPAEALEQMRECQPDGPETEAVCLEALRAAVRAGLPVRKQVEDFCLPRLTRPGTDDAVREDLFAAMQEAGCADAALPALRPLAETRGGEWEDAYEEVLLKGGHLEDLRKWLSGKAGRAGLADETRREIAYDLLDLGDKAIAEQVFQRLAARAPPDHPDVAQLRYLWGPRPETNALAWLEARAAAAPGAEEQAGWLRMLLEAGESRRIVDRVERTAPDREPAPAVLAVYLDAMLELGDTDRLSAWMDRVMPLETRPDALLCYARAAWEAGLDNFAEDAYGRVLKPSPSPHDAEMLKRLAILAFRREADEEARKYFARWTDSGNDPEANYCLGVIAHRERNPKNAAAFFERARQLLVARPPIAFDDRLLRARVLRGTGRNADALKEYAGLASEQPESETVRTEYEELLVTSASEDR